MAKQECELFAFVLGHRIRSLRISKGLSQLELGSGLGSQSLISLIESGRQLPATDILYEIGHRLNSEEILNYAKQLSEQKSSPFHLFDGSNVLLYEALINHQNKWKPVHYEAAISLSDLYYKTKNFKFVDKLTNQIMNHTDDQFIFAKACFYQGSILLTEYQYKDAEEWLKKAEANLDPKETNLKARLMYNLAYLYTQTDNQILALWYAHLAESEFKYLNDIKLNIQTKSLIGVIQRRLGRFTEARKTLMESYELLSRLNDDLSAEARIGSSLADLHLLSGEYEECEYWCLESIKKGLEIGDSGSLSSCYHTLSLLKWKKHNPEESTGLLEKAINIADSVHDFKALAQMFLSATWICQTQHDKLEAALHAYKAAKKTASEALKGAIIDRLAELYIESGQPETARKFQMEALDIYRAYALKNSPVSFTLNLYKQQNEPS